MRRGCFTLISQHTADDDGRLGLVVRIRSCALGAIVSAVSFMKAAINQLFLFPELSLLRDEYFVQHGFTSQTRKMLAELWKSGSP